MDWISLLSAQRFKTENGKVLPTSTPSTEEGSKALRTDFHIDYDRVVFSSSFRRLGRKTQVHPFAESDYTHNRLTHSVEVACVGRSIGNRVGIMLDMNHELPFGISPSDIGSIVQVACLAHDMGNPPFGHTGEEALRSWFADENHFVYLHKLSSKELKDVQTYEGNAHTLRITSNLEMYQNRGGMRLSSASIGALIKYPWTSSAKQGIEKKKFNIYQTEFFFIERVFEEMKLKRIDDESWVRHPLSYLMEAADDICYAFLDLEDAVEMDILDEKDLELVLSPLAPNIARHQSHSKYQYCAMLRGIAIGAAIHDVAHTFIKYKTDLLAGTFPAKDLLSLCSPAVTQSLEEAKKVAREHIFMHKNKLMTEIAAFPCLASILSLLVPAVFQYVESEDKRSINKQNQLALQLLSNNPITESDSLYIAYMKILDYVGGMTDNAAAKMAREVSGIGMV